MPDLVDVLDSKLIHRWLQALLPGLLLLAAAGFGLVVHGHGPFDVALVADSVDTLVGRLNAEPTEAVLTIAGLVVLATVVGFAGEFIGTLIHSLLTSSRPRMIVRLRRWRAVRRARKAGHQLPRYLEPTRVSATGDRFYQLGRRIDTEYGVDATLAWPRLWLLLSDHAIARIQTSYRHYQTGTNLSGYGVLSLAIAVWWWPAALVGLVLVALGLHQARWAGATLADLLEAATDLELRRLAESLGIELRFDRVTREVGTQINSVLAKGA